MTWRIWKSYFDKIARVISPQRKSRNLRKVQLSFCFLIFKFNPETAKYVFLLCPSINCFLQFLSHFLMVSEAKSKLIPFYTIFWVKRAWLFASTCRGITGIFFKPESSFKGLIKLRLLVKTLSMETILGLKVAVYQVTTKKPCFGYFYRFVTRASTLKLQNTYIYVFRAFSDFCKF